MKEEKTTPLRQRMIEDMRIRGMAEKTQAAHIRAVKDFALFLKRSPDTATPEELRAYQLHMTNAGMSATTFNVRVLSLRFFFGMTCGRDEMKRHMQFRRAPRKLPAVLSVEEVGYILAAAPGPGLKYRAALGISYGAGLRAAEVCHLRVQDIDSGRMLIHVEKPSGKRTVALYETMSAFGSVPVVLAHLISKESITAEPTLGSSGQGCGDGGRITTSGLRAPRQCGGGERAGY
ncbi:tyrosine-type recombinase/integrase [Rhodobacter sp. SGA-6-6]|uniref:tyrosine-type recombinase/integrase n=1 Tax=Rhodobacter sp. SGA-6-6 TaxID=2710882 RepID=UPI0013EE1288|nr:site-specific integrase [Rhodobacter sp. SGA-6-6]NGM47553.1 tyrosine-type recombinase/integrase [Rhodobacter sp. SGA-6-6]